MDEITEIAVEQLAMVQQRIGPRFPRSEMRERAQRYMRGLLQHIERKNGWQLAEAQDESGPQGMQRLLNAATWDADLVRDDLRTYVVEQFAEASSGILVLDETGFLKKGRKSAGVGRQYSGTAGRRENQQIGVFLLYASQRGAAFIDRELYLPEDWAHDEARRAEAHIPLERAFATKGILAQQMLQRAFAAHLSAAWVVGDTVYGSDALRQWLEQQQQAYVLAVPSTHGVWTRGQHRTVADLAQQLPAAAWSRLTAGDGSQGPRWYDWAWMQLPYTAPAVAFQQWVLVRRTLASATSPEQPVEYAYYRVFGPSALTLAAVVLVAGHRWAIEIAFEQAKGEVGLDEYEVRRYDAWYRHMTLSMFTHAFLEVTRMQVTQKGAPYQQQA